MKRPFAATIALSVSALAAVGAPLAAHAATARGAASAPATSSAVYNCGNKAQVKPATFVFTCDSTGYLNKLTWTSWTTATATATGVVYTDNCKPNCASGKWSHQNVDVVLWRSEGVKGQPGKRGFTELTILYPNHAIRSGNTETRVPPGTFPGES